MKECVANNGEARDGRGRCGVGTREGSGEQRCVFEVAKEPAHRVEGFGEVACAGPVAAADGGAVADEAAERCGAADGTAGVCADGGDGGALEHAGCGATGGASGERCGIAGLHAVAELGVLAGDAVGERMQMRLAGDDGTESSKLRDEPGVCGCGAVEVAIEVDAA